MLVLRGCACFHLFFHFEFLQYQRISRFGGGYDFDDDRVISPRTLSLSYHGVNVLLVVLRERVIGCREQVCYA